MTYFFNTIVDGEKSLSIIASAPDETSARRAAMRSLRRIFPSGELVLTLDKAQNPEECQGQSIDFVMFDEYALVPRQEKVHSVNNAVTDLMEYWRAVNRNGDELLLPATKSADMIRDE